MITEKRFRNTLKKIGKIIDSIFIFFISIFWGIAPIIMACESVEFFSRHFKFDATDIVLALLCIFISFGIPVFLFTRHVAKKRLNKKVFILSASGALINFFIMGYHVRTPGVFVFSATLTANFIFIAYIPELCEKYRKRAEQKEVKT